MFALVKNSDFETPESKALDAIEAAMLRNLRGLSLFAEARRPKHGFREIRASTSADLVTTPGAPNASGIMLLLAARYEPPLIVFQEINSRRRGLGRAMVAATLAGARADPELFRRVRVNDLSPFQADGRRWWEHVAEEQAAFEWLVTHEEETTYLAGPERP